LIFSPSLKQCFRVFRRTEYNVRFKRDDRREQAGRHAKTRDAALLAITDRLASDIALPRRAFDHALQGDRIDHRDCPITVPMKITASVSGS
jgi:mRNA-degrading endonuclease YafQ of YafQ-DinJ toxin-antitoxin module